MIRVAMLVWNEFRNDARVLKEAQTLQAAGYHVTVFALHTPGVTAEQQTLDDGVEVVRVARSPLWWLHKRKVSAAPDVSVGAVFDGPIGRLGLVKQVLSIIARFWTHFGLLWRMVMHNADIVHAHDVNVLPTAWLAAKLSGAKIVYDAHEISTSREGYSSFRNLVAGVERFLMPRVQGAITTTDARAKFFARAYGVMRPVVLQNRPRHQVAQSSNRIREELSLNEPWPIVLYQGGVQQGRGLERLVQVAALVPNAYFVFIGGGRLDASLRSITAELGLEERVHFISTVALAELPSYTASSNIGVQPIENTCLNHYTTDSNKLFEYVQAGLTVVASDLPEIRRVVREHDLGLLVPAGDSAALAAALRTLVVDKAKRRYYADQSCKAAATLSWESQEHNLLELYRKVFAKKY